MTRLTAGRRLRCAAAMLLLALTGCSKPSFRTPDTLDQSSIGQVMGGNDGHFSAVAQRFTLLVPNAEVEAAQKKHTAECIKLGCIIFSSSIDQSDGGVVTAHMSIHIKPDAYDGFAAVLSAAPARIRFHSQTANDMATPALDNEKRLATKIAFRERLTALLNDQSTKTAADLIAIEKELSQVQGEVENLTVQLESLHKETDMVRVDINYVGTNAGFGGFDLQPLHDAVRNIGRTVVGSLAALVYSLAAIAPWLPVIAIVWWIVRRTFRRRRLSRDAASAPSA